MKKNQAGIFNISVDGTEKYYKDYFETPFLLTVIYYFYYFIINIDLLILLSLIFIINTLL